jgi:hypothetical protein
MVNTKHVKHGECGGCYRPIEDHPNEECKAYFVPIYHPITGELVGHSYLLKEKHGGS